ncbi:MAG: hypothetical protein GXO36_06965 [Chloroflexi bacterium]|nr:hypothetical protein [Chloroflexota bacterium]
MAQTVVLRALYELQQIDLRLAELERRVSAARERLNAAEAVRQAEQAFREAARAMQQAEEQLKAAEQRATQLRAKLKRSETRLYDGSIRNPRELQALQAEVESLRRRLDQAEEEAVARLLAYEQVEARYLEALQHLEAVRRHWNVERQQLQAQIQEDEARLARLREQRAWWLNRIPADVLEQYEHLRRIRGGLAVAGVREGVCGACGATLSAAQRQQVYRMTLTHCETCGRILYPLD